MTRPLRIAIKVAAALLALVLAFLTVTFGQVWYASTRDNARPADAIVVLGAAQYNGRPSPVLQRRLDHALLLYRAGFAEIVVVTGGKRPGDATTEAAAAAEFLQSNGVPAAALRLEVQGTNTFESLAAASRFLAEEDIDDVLLVSDDYHSLRVKAIANALGMHAAVSPADSGHSTTGQLRALVRETLAVGAGRIIGFRRLMRLDEVVERVRPTGMLAPGLFR